MELILKYFPDLNAKQIDAFHKMYSLYLEWNSKINVISRKDIEALYLKHVLHSLSIAKIFPIPPGSDVVDVGTGGGFPGIPLAVFFPDVNFHLVDSIRKKILVAESVAEALHLENVSSQVSRSEKLNPEFDYVVSRAVTSFPAFFNLVKNCFKKTGKNIQSETKGIIYLKGGDFTDEIAGYDKMNVFPIKDVFEEEFFETKSLLFLPFV